MNIIASDDEEVECITRSIGVITAGDTYRFSFVADPDDWKRCKRLEIVLYEASDVLMIAENASVLNDETEDDNPYSQVLGKSSGGCEMGISAFGLILVLSALKRKPAK